MTGNSIALYVGDDPKDVLIAVGADFAHFEQISAFLALLPKLRARPAPEMRKPALLRRLQGGFIPMREHQDIS
jgi:hypothetical protein